MVIKAVKPLGAIVDAYLWLHQHTSLRSILFGPDPSKTPRMILKNQTHWFNRDTLVDVYAIGWPIIECWMLWSVGSGLGRHWLGAGIIGLFAAYRGNELFGGVFYVLILRSHYDAVDGRKFAFSLLAYLEPILLFAIIHGSLSLVLASHHGWIPGTGYSLSARSWNALTMLHYSVGCYTTIGTGNMSPTLPATTVLSDFETAVGIIMLTLTISRFGGAVVEAGMQRQKDISRQKQE